MTIRIFRLFFAFQGRADRTTFWLVLAGWLVAGEAFLHWWVWYVADVGPSDRVEVDAALFTALFPALFSCCAVTVRRLHDCDRSGWLAVPFLVCPAALQTCLPGELLHRFAWGPDAVMALLWHALLIWGGIEAGLRRGMPIANRYGRATASLYGLSSGRCFWTSALGEDPKVPFEVFRRGFGPPDTSMAEVAIMFLAGAVSIIAFLNPAA